MAKRKEKEATLKKGLRENVKLEFNKIYESTKVNKTLVIKKVFLDYEEMYECDIKIYDINGWQKKFYTNEPFTLKEICDELQLDYDTVIKPETV